MRYRDDVRLSCPKLGEGRFIGIQLDETEGHGAGDLHASASMNRSYPLLSALKLSSTRFTIMPYRKSSTSFLCKRIAHEGDLTDVPVLGGQIVTIHHKQLQGYMAYEPAVHQAPVVYQTLGESKVVSNVYWRIVAEDATYGGEEIVAHTNEMNRVFGGKSMAEG